MYIKELRILRFRHLENVRLGPFLEPGSRSSLIVLTGPNGSGKSAILSLLAYGLASNWNLNASWFDRNEKFEMEMDIAITPLEQKIIGTYLENPSNSQFNHEIYRHAFQTLENNGGVYTRKLTDGRTDAGDIMLNSLHALITSVLRNTHGRPAGFFIRSDRQYDIDQTDPASVFGFTGITQQSHVWEQAFNSSSNQINDMFRFLIQSRYHFFKELGFHVFSNSDSGKPVDPLAPYDELLTKLLPGYKFAVTNLNEPTDLIIELPNGTTVPFQQLSSGEKEVFFTLAFFKRHNVTDAIIILDEPELHLHPELTRSFINLLQTQLPHNQLRVATHSPEIIDFANLNNVIFVSRDSQTYKSLATAGKDENGNVSELKKLFGYSGYVGVARKLIFLEGRSDRRIFDRLFSMYSHQIKFVSVGSSENQAPLNSAVLSILENNLGWTEYYFIRDRDYVSKEMETQIRQKYKEIGTSHLHILERHEIENYLIDEETISLLLQKVFNKNMSSIDVNKSFQKVAKTLSSKIIQDMTAFRLNLFYHPIDFSNINLKTNIGLESDSENGLDFLIKKVHSKINDINAQFEELNNFDALTNLISVYVEEVNSALTTTRWKSLYPGKDLLKQFAHQNRIDASRLQEELINELAAKPEKIPQELSHLIEAVLNGDSLNRHI